MGRGRAALIIGRGFIAPHSHGVFHLFKGHVSSAVGWRNGSALLSGPRKLAKVVGSSPTSTFWVVPSLKLFGPFYYLFLYLVVRIIVSSGAGPATVRIIVAPGGGTVLLNAYSTSYSCSWWQNVCLMSEVHETGLIRTTSYITGLGGGDAVSQGIFIFDLTVRIGSQAEAHLEV